jgi:hypothetical protein
VEQLLGNVYKIIHLIANRLPGLGLQEGDFYFARRMLELLKKDSKALLNGGG